MVGVGLDVTLSKIRQDGKLFRNLLDIPTNKEMPRTYFYFCNLANLTNAIDRSQLLKRDTRYLQGQISLGVSGEYFHPSRIDFQQV